MNAASSLPDEILVVDSTPTGLKLLAGVLGDAGYRVRLARDGEQALRSVGTLPPALVLLDTRIPDMDGYEICRRLKGDERTRSIPVVFLSSVEDESEEVKAFQAGALDFIRRPIRAAEVLARVGTHLALRHAQQDLQERNAELEENRKNLAARVRERSADLEEMNRRLQEQIAKHLRTLHALGESEKKYRRLVDTASEGIWVLGPDKLTSFVNARMAEVLGCSGEEMIGRPATDFMFDEDIPDHLARTEKRRLGNRERYERKFRRKDGTAIWALVSATPIFDEAGQFGGSFAMITDIDARKRAEEVLARSEAQLSEAQRIAQIGSWELDIPSNTLVWSEEVYRMFEIDPARFGSSYEAFLDAVHPDDRKAVDSAYRSSLKTHTPYSVDHRLLFGDGRVKHVHEHCETSFDIEGSPLRSVGTVQDITERKRVEESLCRTNRELQALSSCNQALLHADDEPALLAEVCRIICEEAGYRMVWVGFAMNDEAKTVRPVAWAGADEGYLEQAKLTWAEDSRYGRGPSGTAIRTGESETIRDFRDDPNADPWRAAALERGFRSSISLPLKDEGGNTFGILNIYADMPNAFTPEETRLLEELAGDMAFGIAVLRTRAEHKQFEETLRISEEKFAAAFHASPNLIAITRFADGTILDVNDGYSRMLGYSHAESLGKTTAELAIWADPADRATFAGRLKENGYINDFETKLRCKDGTIVTVLDSAQTIVIHGETCILSVAHDITERKRNEEEREKLQGQLLHAQKLESVGRLAGGVAHDFNNLLAVILGYTELALDKASPNDPLRADMEEIQRAGEHAADLTRHLLAFARKQTVSPKILDLNSTVANMLSMLQRLIGEDIELAWRPGEGLWPVKVDPSQIDQILANLCVNARDSIEEVGTIVIETANASFADAYCKDHPDCSPGEYVRISVSDNGCGMEKEVLERIFEPFFTTKEMGKGTGLGLSTVYGIVRQNLGFINVSSEPGKGTTFHIHLPHIQETNLPDAGEGHSRKYATGQETVLVVEDDTALLDLCRTILEELGYRVLVAGSPTEAIALAERRNCPVDLLVTDVVMPEMNGRDLSKRLLSVYPDLKLLFMSGYTADVIAHHGILEEDVCFVQKPFSRHELSMKVRAALQQG